MKNKKAFTFILNPYVAGVLIILFFILIFFTGRASFDFGGGTGVSYAQQSYVQPQWFDQYPRCQYSYSDRCTGLCIVASSDSTYGHCLPTSYQATGRTGCIQYLDNIGGIALACSSKFQ